MDADKRSAASRLGKSGLNLSLVAAGRAASICGYKIFSHRERIFTLVAQDNPCLKLSPSPLEFCLPAIDPSWPVA